MNNIIEIYKEQLKEAKENFQKILNQISPLEQKKNRIEKDIQALQYLINSKTEEMGTIIDSENQYLINGLIGKTGMDAYRQIAKNYFNDKSFKENDIRNYATENGLLVKGKPITEVTSRGIIAELLKGKYLKKVNRGLYKYKKQGEEQISFRRDLDL